MRRGFRKEFSVPAICGLHGSLATESFFQIAERIFFTSIYEFDLLLRFVTPTRGKPQLTSELGLSLLLDAHYTARAARGERNLITRLF